jgi:hypothetical protein
MNNGFEKAQELIEQAHRRGPNIASVARVAEDARSESEKLIRRAHGETCGACPGRTTNCPARAPADCQHSAARTVEQLTGLLADLRKGVLA